MIKTEQSADEDEGFFKPQQKIVSFKKQQSHLQSAQDKNQPNNLVVQDRPADFTARIISKFQRFNPYPQYLTFDKCQQERQQLKSLSMNKEKLSKKYVTLEEKYKNNTKYKVIYEKLNNLAEFNSYIFSLENYMDYNSNNYIQSVDIQADKSKNNTMNQEIPFIFDSNFQSGNLMYVFQNLEERQIPTFDLIIQNDTNTKGYNQWFYFSIQRNLKKFSGKSIRINIVNFIKKHLMFEDGVRPVACFENSSQWKFIGRQVEYKKSYIKRIVQAKGSEIIKNYYTLSFILDFQESALNKDHEKVYIALNYPYTYKRMINLLDQIIQNNKKPEQIEIIKQTLCYSVSSNQIPYLKISSIITQKQIAKHLKEFQAEEQKLKQKQELSSNLTPSEQQRNANIQQIKNIIHQNKKKIIIFARQHPGQTVSSFVLQGFLQSLMDLDQEINRKLIKQYTIYIFPMINVDGVIYGNFRTNLGGFDLNRQWKNPNQWLHPEIYHLKKFINKLDKIQFVLDFHGHSRKLNSFIYSCCNPVPILIQNEDENDFEDISMFRLFPYIISKNCELFSIKDCTYSISRDKIKTARINTFQNLNFNPFIYTFETGFYGYTEGEKKFRYKIQNFEKIGKDVFESLVTLLLKKKKVKQYLKQVKARNYLFDKWSFQNKQDPGSQSNPSEDQLNPIQIKTKVFAQRKITQTQEVLKKIQKIKKKQLVKKKMKQRKIIQLKVQQFKSKPEIIPKIIQQSKPIALKSQSGRNQRTKLPLAQKQLKKSEQSKNFVAIKQANVQKPSEYFFVEPKASDKFIKSKRRMRLQEFKSSSNLLGSGLSYFQQKNVHLLSQIFKKNNEASLQTLQINNLKKQKRFQSYSSVLNYQNSQGYSKVNNLSLRKENEIREILEKRQKDKKSLSKKSEREKVYLVRDNKIVRKSEVVNKRKSTSQKLLWQNQISIRRQNLLQCQQVMNKDKGLIQEIQKQMQGQKKNKKVYLNPIQF